MTAIHQTGGLILAGGRSSRMLGKDKTLLPLHGSSLLNHVVGRLRQQVSNIALNSNADPRQFAGYGLPVIPDQLTGFLGPLAGIHAGLMHHPTNFLVTVAVDLPFLPSDLVSRLHAGLGTRTCAYAYVAGQHVLALLWRPGSAALVEAYLQGGGRRLRDFLQVHGQPVPFDKPKDRLLLCNLNTPEDWTRAESELALQTMTPADDVLG